MGIYKDKNGKKIERGMKIEHDEGDIEEVYLAGDELGLSATNKDYVGYVGIVTEIYPLHEFNLKEWKIV